MDFRARLREEIEFNDISVKELAAKIESATALFCRTSIHVEFYQMLKPLLKLQKY